MIFLRTKSHAQSIHIHRFSQATYPIFAESSQIKGALFRHNPSGRQKGNKMKKQIMAVAVLTSAALLGSTGIANADAKSDYKAAVASWKASTQEAKSSYKSAVTAYKAGKKSFASAKKAISEKFKTDAAALKARTDAAIAAASTDEAKAALVAAAKTEKDALVAARNAAIAALTPVGSVPTKPAKQAKPAKPSSNS